MKVIHVVQGKVNPNRSNGVNSVIYGLTNSMNSLIDVQVIGISKGVKPNTIILRDKIKVYLFPYCIFIFFKPLYCLVYVLLHRRPSDFETSYVTSRPNSPAMSSATLAMQIGFLILN